MTEYLYQWLQNLSFYLIIVHMVIQLIPNNSYKKYIRFYTGLLLIVLLVAPILKLFGMEQGFKNIYNSVEYKQQIREIEESTKYLEDMTLEGMYIEE